MSTNPINARLGAKALALLAAAALAFPLVSAPAATASPSDTFAPRLDYQFRDHEVDVGARLADLVSQLTLDEKIALASGSSAAAIERLGLNAGRSVAGGEGLHGIQGGNATVYPSSLGLSQSWDNDLLYDIGATIAEEGLATAENMWWMFFGGDQWAPGAPGRLAPVLDLLRDPRYGRAYETFGEDAYLTGALGTAITGGMNQRTADGYQQFVPALKHPLAYGTEINRLWTNSVMPQRVKNEYYIKPFKYPISAGHAKSLMNSYPLVNGKPMSVNPLQDALLNEWTPDYEGTGHYEYTTMNDYGSGSSMWVHSQRYFADTPEGRALGVAEGVQNGQMSWSLRDYGGWTSSTDMLYEAYARGMVTEADIEENAKRALAMAFRLGDYDHLELQNPYMAMGSVPRDDLLPDNRKSAFDASAEQIVLLKNDGALPLSGAGTNDAVLLGSLGEDILKDHYTGNFVYGVTIKDAFENKLGAANVHYNRAVDTVAFKAPNESYLKAADNGYSDPGSSSAGGTFPVPTPADVPVTAGGVPAGASVDMNDTELLFEHYDFGELSQLLRTPVNDRFVQVPHTQSAAANRGLMVNNTSQPGQATLTGGNTQYVNYQTFRVVGTNDGKVGLYNQIAGNGGNNSYNESAMAYDQDDEDLNNGSYMALQADGTIKADTTDTHVGPFRNENHVVGADVTEAPFDTNGNDKVVDGLPAAYKFGMEVVESNTAAIDAQVAAASPGAPIIMVVGYDPHLNAREAIDLQETGLSAQQMENITHVTDTLERDVILVVKTGSPMTIDASVHDNPRVKAIVEIGHSGQEEGSALVAALFDDGYEVPPAGFAPAASKYSPYASYADYPGYLPEGETSIAGFSPAGRLSATWYREVEDMIGASEDNPPASYRWPAYSESGNDNLSNMNGTVPKGLMTYDIVKGERTYQYFKGAPLYEFGYGLTYTDFAYTANISPMANGTFTVSGTVENTGDVTSDEVVQVYSTYGDIPSRIQQPEKRLIAFNRLKDIAPNEVREFSFQIDALDKLGVWDVERSDFIIEPGAYRIAVGPSSGQVGASGALSVTAANGGTAAGTRDLTQLTMAEAFDDYSNHSLDGSDIEIVSTSDALYSAESVWLRQAGAWLNYQDVEIAPGTDTVTVRAGADRTGSLEIYALPPGSPAGVLASSTPVATIALSDTRPVSGLATGLGIGPIALRNSAFANHQYPGTPEGQNGLDSKGSPYKDAYITPEYENLLAQADLPAGTWDIYVVSTARGARVEWLQLASDPAAAASMEISQLYSADSIRTKGGTLDLDATPSPASSVSPITWSVAGSDGAPTNLATIDQTGLVTASGNGNGTVVVTAESNGAQAQLDVLITNQLDSNKVSIAGAPKTVEYPIMRSGAAFGQSDTIRAYRGSNAQSVVFSELYAENPASFYLPGALLNIPAGQMAWSVTDAAGNPTSLATVSAIGVVTATGSGDGEVVVTAKLKANPDISTSRVITILNQAGRDPYRMIQMEHNDSFAPALPAPPGGFPPAATLSTWGMDSNETGTAARTGAGVTHTFGRVDFRDLGATEFAIRLASDTANTATPFNLEIWADAPTAAAGGTLVATVSDTTDTSVGMYHTYVAGVADDLTGLRDIFITSDAALRINWWTFGAGARIDDEASALLEAVSSLPQAANPPAVWADFTQARDALAAVLANSSASQDDLDSAQAALEAAFAVIEVPAKADVGALNAVIGAAGALNEADYTPASWAGVAGALATASAVAGSGYPVQSEVDAAYAALLAAIGGLVIPEAPEPPQPPGPDPAAELAAAKAVLSQLMTAAAGVASGEDVYTEATWAAYTTALAAANRVAAASGATLAEVNSARTGLANAMAALVKRPAPEPPDPGVAAAAELAAAKTSLNLLIATSSALAPTQAQYTAESWAAYSAALGEAQRLAGSQQATTAQVRAAAAALSAAMAGLVHSPVTMPPPPSVSAPPLPPQDIPAPAQLTGVRVSQASVRVVRGAKVLPLAVAYTTAGAEAGAVAWSSSKPSVVKVNKKTGRILGLKRGTATITATTLASTPAGKAITAKIKVTVVAKKVKATAVSAAVPKTLGVGASKKLSAKVRPAKATGAQVRFSSSNSAVLRVDGAGLITGVSAGKAKVTIKAGGKTKSYTVTVG